MGPVGDALDNALCENFFATLETELIDRRRFATQAEARREVFGFIEGFYETRRLHTVWNRWTVFGAFASRIPSIRSVAVRLRSTTG